MMTYGIIPDTKRPVRWIRSQCPACGDVTNEIIHPQKYGRDLGDVYIDFLKCDPCERLCHGLPAVSERRHVDPCPDKQKRVEAQPRNCGGDKRVWAPEY